MFRGSGACPTSLDSAIASVETSWSLHGGLVRKDFDRDTKVERGDLEAFVDFMFGGVSYDDRNASAARSVLETLAGHVDALGMSYNQLDKLDADTLYSVVSFSAASAIDRGAVSDAADKFRVMMFGGAPAKRKLPNLSMRLRPRQLVAFCQLCMVRSLMQLTVQKKRLSRPMQACVSGMWRSLRTLLHSLL